MFLVERLIGVSIYSYILIMICFLIAFSNLKCKAIFGLYVIILSIMSYFYEPYVTADLYRTFVAIGNYASMNFKSFFETYVVTSSVPASRILFWLIGKTGSYHLLSVVACACTYSLFFHIIEDVRERFAISRKNVAITLFFLMSTSIYISVIGGVRMMLAMLLMLFCFYRESVEKKYNVLHIVLYIIAVFMHDMALIILSIRLLAAAFDKRKSANVRMRFVAGVVLLILTAVLGFDYKFARLFEKSLEYLFEDTYSDTWEYIMGVIIFVLFVIISIKFIPDKDKYVDINALNGSTFISAAIAISCCYVFSIFYRFMGHMVPVLGAPMLMITLEERRNISINKRKIISVESLVLLISVLLLFISGTRGSLSSFKFFVLG